MASSNPETFLVETWSFLGGYEFFWPREDKDESLQLSNIQIGSLISSYNVTVTFYLQFYLGEEAITKRTE